MNKLVFLTMKQSPSVIPVKTGIHWTIFKWIPHRVRNDIFQTIWLNLFVLTFLTLLFFLLTGSVIPSYSATIDPLKLGIGARQIGMGKVSAAVSEDSSSIFFNPAGLAVIELPSLTSMYSNVTEDVSYAAIGYSQLTKLGNFGFGFLRLGTDGILKADSQGQIGNYFSYGDNIMLLSYGKKLDEKLSWGATLKYYQQTFESINKVSSFNLDLGFKYNLNPNLTLGFLQRNALPKGIIFMGDEQLESQTKLGLGYLLRENLLLGFDLDFKQSRPMVLQSGLEWKTYKFLSIRGGFEQVPINYETTVANYSLGLGFNFGNTSFDYAYYIDNTLDYNNTSFFSLSYKFPKKIGKVEEIIPIVEEAPLPIPQPNLTIYSPEDKLITYNRIIEVKGQTDVGNKVSINENEITVNEKGEFSKSFYLPKYGKHGVIIKAVNPQGKSEEIIRRVLLLAKFDDVDDKYWAKNTIEHLATLKVMNGTDENNFAPKEPITRAQFTAALENLTSIPAKQFMENPFIDVKKGHWAFNTIADQQKKNWIYGYPKLYFGPSKFITYAEALAIVGRIMEINKPVTGYRLRVTGSELRTPNLPVRQAGSKLQTITDDGRLNPKHWAYNQLLALEQTGKFLEPGSRIDLKDDLNRAQAVSIISRSQIADTKIAGLLNWEQGYFAKPVDSIPLAVYRQQENGRLRKVDNELSSSVISTSSVISNEVTSLSSDEVRNLNEKKVEVYKIKVKSLNIK